MAESMNKDKLTRMESVDAASHVVVIGADGSQRAMYAFDFYIEHVHRPENYVLIVHTVEVVCDHPLSTLPVPYYIYEAEFEKEKLKAKDIEDSYVQKLKEHQIRGRYVTLAGNPGHVIVHIANEKKAHLIIVGTRGRGKVRRTILGSVSGYVLHHAHCAVSVVRSPITTTDKKTRHFSA